MSLMLFFPNETARTSRLGCQNMSDMKTKIADIILYRVNLPLVTPYRLSYRTFESFEPILIKICDQDGRVGWGEQHISPGSSTETREGGWRFVKELAENITGLETGAAKELIGIRAHESIVASTALVTAIEMLERANILQSVSTRRIRLLTAFNATKLDEVPDEVERRLIEGFKTFKIKVGKDVDDDLKMVAHIQECVDGRATLRVDANRAYNREDGCAFASALDPTGIELFEQPSGSEDWESNAAVAAVSKVPLMLDEPICALPDIARAAKIDGVKLCKLKLKRFGGLATLEAAILAAKEVGLGVVLGDGLGAEINSWMEGCVADHLIDNAGEYNGYVKIKPEHRLLKSPLPFEDGHMIVPAGWWPEIDQDKLAFHAIETISVQP